MEKKRRGPLTILKTNRKARWTAVVIAVLLVAYPLSFGIAARICFILPSPTWADPPPQWMKAHWRTVYAPVIWVWQKGPKPARDMIEWYVMTCARIL